MAGRIRAGGHSLSATTEESFSIPEERFQYPCVEGPRRTTKMNVVAVRATKDHAVSQQSKMRGTGERWHEGTGFSGQSRDHHRSRAGNRESNGSLSGGARVRADLIRTRS